MEQNLEKHYKQANFDIDEIIHVLYGTEGDLEAFNKTRETPKDSIIAEDRLILSKVLDDPVIKYNPAMFDLSRSEWSKSNFRKWARIREIIKEHNLPLPDNSRYVRYGICLNAASPMHVSHGLVEPLIKILGSDEQIDKWHKAARSEEISGAYVQTEIGHGSDVQNLETTIEYDIETGQYIVNTPTTEAIKFWPGEVAFVATHIVLFGRLIIKGKDYGVQSFMFQVRDIETNRLFPGIETGDIGPKYGFSIKDNGYIIFDKFRAPNDALLSKYVTVTKDGEFKIKGNPKVAYGAMLQLRVMLIEYNYGGIFHCLQVAIRYGLFRKQFRSLSNSREERHIFDYQGTQSILINILAYSYSNVFIARYLKEQKDEMLEEIQTGKFNKMKDLHSQVSALKAYYMQGMMESIAQCRECCGGHGYLQSAGFAFMQDILSPNVTLEGDAYVLYQQTAKDIFKHLAKLAKGELIEGDYDYLNEIGFVQGQTFDDKEFTNENLLQIIKYSALAKIMSVGTLLRMKNGLSFDVNWNKKYLFDIITSAKMHAVYISNKVFMDKIDSMPMSKGLKENMQILYQIYATDCILKYCGDAHLSGYITADHLQRIRDLNQDLVTKIAPRALALVDGTNVEKKLLRSVIASPKSPYDEIYNTASSSRLNEKDKLTDHRFVTELSKKLIAKI